MTDQNQTNVEDIDWPALWAEFGFDTPGPDGKRAKAPLKVKTAIEVSEQRIAGNPQTIIDHAIQSGILQQVETLGTTGEPITAGYRLESNS